MSPPLPAADVGLRAPDAPVPVPVPGEGVEGRGPAGRPRPPGRPARRHSERTTWTALLVVAVVGSLLHAGVGRGDVFNPAGWPQLRRFFAAALQPRLDGEFLRLTADATLTTLSYAVLGTALAVVVGLVGGVLVSETWWQRVASPWRTGDRPPSAGSRRTSLGADAGRTAGWTASRVALGLPRGVHEAVWGLLLVGILGFDPLVAVLAIGIPYGAVTAKVYSELLDEAPRAAFDALRATGVGRAKALCYSLGPLAFADMLSYAFYRFECSVRGAAILGIVGAGGLGFELALSFQSLRYPEMWTLLYALVVVCGLADWWSTALRRRAALPAPARSAGEPGGEGGPALRRDRRLVGSLVAAAGLVVVAVVHLGVDPSTLWAPRARRLASDMAASSLPPDLGGEQVATLARLSLETLSMSVVATALAWIGGMALAFAAASTLGRADVGAGARLAPRALRRAAALGTRGVLLGCRAVPPPVGALLVLFVFFPGPLPGALALAVYNLGILGRLMTEVVENLDPHPVRALRSSGASAGAALIYGAVPRALPRFATYGLYRWEVTIRETVVVGLVGAGGLGRLLGEQVAAFDHRGVAATLLALVALSVAVDLTGAALRRALR